MADEKELAYISSLVDRFDQAISQLADVSISMDKMLAVHEQRLEQQEKQNDVIHTRINDFKKEVMEEIKELRVENTTQHKSTNDRLDKLEKWRWFVVGVATVLGFILAQMSNIKGIFD